MNTTPHYTLWARLVARARRAPVDTRPVTLPYGFSTRVAELGLGVMAERSVGYLMERFSWRALGLAGALAAVTVGLTYQPISRNIEEEISLASDPIVSLLDPS